MSNERNENRIITEETLIEDIAELVRRFLARPNRTNNYDGTIDWRIFSDNTISVQISIQRSHTE